MHMNLRYINQDEIKITEWFIKSSTDSKRLCIKRYLKFHAIPCYSMILNKADVHLSTGA